MSKIRPLLLALVALIIGFSSFISAQAEGEVTFTLTLKSASLRAAPNYTARRAYSMFQGQTYPVNARTPDNLWVRLSFPGAGENATWIAVANGTVTGNLNSVPALENVVEVAAPPTSVAAETTTTQTTAQSVIGGQFIVSVRSAYARSAPERTAAPVASLFKNQKYPIVAQSDDRLWVQLNLGNGFGWVQLSYGTVKPAANGPVPAATPGTSSRPTNVLPAAALPSVSANAQAIYQRGLANGTNPNAFSKIGDCQSVTPYFLAPFDKGEYRLGTEYAYLQSAITQFSGSFGRESLAAKDGLSALSMLDPLWANPKFCQKGENPLTCELRVQNPSIAFISLGTNGGWQSNDEYERGLRQIIETLTARGTVPILSTKADNLEGGDRFNLIVLRLAGEYDVPLWHFQLAAQTLPNNGIVDTYHLGWGQAFFDLPTGLGRGWQVRNLTALQSLYLVWQGVK